MAEYIENVASQTSKLDWAFPFQRTGSFPLDRSALFSSFLDAQNYALGVAEGDEAKDERKLGGSSYVGQVISVFETVDDEAVANAYIIAPSRELVKLATTAAVGDIDATLSKLQGELVDLSAQLVQVNNKADSNNDSIIELQGQIKGVTDNHTSLDTRIKAVEDDHLKASDKSELQIAITDAKSDAIAQAKAEAENQIKLLETTYLTGEGAAETIDTLNEIAAWIGNDNSGAVKIVSDINAIQNDYLKAADKQELSTALNALQLYVGSLPEDSTSENVIAYINEAIRNLNIDDYAKESQLTELSNTVNDISAQSTTNASNISTLQDIVRTINNYTVDGTTIVNTDGVLSVGSITSNNISDLSSLLDNKVDKHSSEYKGVLTPHRLITPEEIDKLSKLSIEGDNVTTGQTVTAGSVEGLSNWITDNKDTVPGLVSEAITTDINAALVTAQSAVREIVIGNDTIVSVEGKVELPIASLEKLGIVKSSEDVNKVRVNEDGTMEVNSLNVNTLTQTEGEELILCGGSALSFK